MRLLSRLLGLWLGLLASAACALTADEAVALLDLTGPATLERVGEGVPGWLVRQDGRVVGHVASTWEVAETVGYSGRPLDVLLALTPEATIAGARLVSHSEPVLTLGIAEADIQSYVAGFEGYDLHAPVPDDSPDALPEVISRATVSTGVIRDGILRTARALAAARGLIETGGGVDRLSYSRSDWAGLVAMGAISEVRVSMTEAAHALEGAKVPVPPGSGDFLHLWTGLIDPPSVGQTLLGQQGFTAAVGSLAAGETVLFLASVGAQSHRGTDWRKTGVFDRVSVVQGDTRWQPTEDRYIRVDRLRADGAPEIREISLFRLPPDFDPLQSLKVEVLAERPTATGRVTLTIPVNYSLPEAFRRAPPPEPEPLWRSAWREDRPAIFFTGAMLAVLALAFLGQEALTHRPRLWRSFRLGYLACTLVILGWGLGGQLSVVQVIAFLHALLNGFRWETFLVDPVIFLLWGFVALGLLFWGRGVYCGWLCAFGALQELLNNAAVRLGVQQVEVPQALHERLWIIKYTLFVVLVALSFHSMTDAVLLAEAEPFKTAITLRFLRAWPFVLYVLLLLGAGLFIERFFCRYLCPLGAGLGIPAKLKVFDWLHRRPQCGRECRLCQAKCTVGAIDGVGRINPNECVLCLRCQVIMNDCATCPVLKRRARAA
ncbi:NosR/NirI family protein [Donghicola mangrovi]|uniref:4Fe-4S binding protein n=1 Tax=Donghicola mangrovi TaxID=2729614 RepID=A0A850QEI4_9RHOB|nr:NosR/NirI family protein [Donghicola mangrovi]NVO25358.1 4Fe-4S binding protein [Donghicola mangrovi]